MRKDVIRGVLCATAVSLIALGAIATDRMIRPNQSPPPFEAPIQAAQIDPEPLSAAVPTPAEPIPPPTPAFRAPRPVTQPATRLTISDDVPQPPAMPPLAVTAQLRPAPAVLAEPHQQPEPPVPPAASAASVERVTNYAESGQPVAEPPAGPAKRAIRSVGRVFGIGRKKD